MREGLLEAKELLCLNPKLYPNIKLSPYTHKLRKAKSAKVSLSIPPSLPPPFSFSLARPRSLSTTSRKRAKTSLSLSRSLSLAPFLLLSPSLALTNVKEEGKGIEAEAQTMPRGAAAR